MGLFPPTLREGVSNPHSAIADAIWRMLAPPSAMSQRTYGNTVTLDKPTFAVKDLLGVINMLCQKSSVRMRRDGFSCRTVQLSFVYADGSYYRHHLTLKQSVDSLGQVFKVAVLSFNRQKGRATFPTSAA